MDPDEAESAGIHSHDRLIDTPRSPGGGGNGGWGCRLLRRGWDLTRKAAIAGAAATVAPVVAPPLIVLSAAGAALSVPFAAYLVSVAATNHLMDALLRSCYPPPQPYYHQEDDGVEQEFLNASEAYGHLDTETEESEEDEGDTSLLLPRDHGVSEASFAAVPEEEEEEEVVVEGEFSIHESGQGSYTSNSGDETEEHTPVVRGFGVSASAVPLFSDEDSQVQKKGQGELSVLDSAQQSFGSENWNEKEDDVYYKNREDDAMEEIKYTNETVSQGFDYPELRVPASGGDDNLVQEKGEGEIFVQNSGQQSFQSKNLDVKEEEDGKTTEENKSTNETLSQGFYFPEPRVTASGDDENVVQEKGEGEFSAQNVGQYPLLTNTGDKNELGMPMKENKSTEDMPPRDFAVSESSVPVLYGDDDVVQSKQGFEVAAQEVVEEANSNTDLAMGDVAHVQPENIAIAAPESEGLPPSNLVARESPTDPVAGEVVDVRVIIAAAVEPESEVLHPSNIATSESPADPVTGEIVDVQVDIVAAAEPGSEVLPLSSLAACESQVVAETAHVGEVKNEQGMPMEEKKSAEDMPPRDFVVSESPAPVFHSEDNVFQSKEGSEVAVLGVVEEANSNRYLVMSEVAEVEIIAIAAPESEGLPPSNLVAQVDIIAAPVPGSEVLPLSSLAACESQAVAETAHVGEAIGITVMEDIVRDFGDVNRGSAECCYVSAASVHDGEDVMSIGSTPYLSTVEEEMFDHPNQSTSLNAVMNNEAFGSRAVAGGEAHYTEEQLREQLDTIRTITGYGASPSSTLEADLAGLYIFVGVEVEPAVGSGDASDRLMELNTKLRLLKSIIGVD